MEKERSREIHDYIYRVAREASKIARESSRDRSMVSVKGLNVLGDESREIDLVLERFIIEEIRREYPRAKIISEESGVIDGGENLYFIIDPLDGSVNYATDTPYCSVSIAVVERERDKPDLVAGVVSEIFRDKTYSFISGEGVYINNTRAEKRRSPEKVLITYLEDPRAMRAMYDIWEYMKRPKIRSLGSAALDIVKTSLGHYIAFIDLRGRLRNIDIVSAYGFALNIGSYVTDREGSPLNIELIDIARVESIVVSSYREIHENIIRVLRDVYKNSLV
ncbi:MAG: inositol monophosphatase [Sulfolobales archaeon]